MWLFTTRQRKAFLQKRKEGFVAAERCYGYYGHRFICFLWWNGLTHISLGVSLYWPAPNLEIHIPGGFIRVGLRRRGPPLGGPPTATQRSTPSHPPQS